MTRLQPPVTHNRGFEQHQGINMHGPGLALHIGIALQDYMMRADGPDRSG